MDCLAVKNWLPDRESAKTGAASLRAKTWPMYIRKTSPFMTSVKQHLYTQNLILFCNMEVVYNQLSSKPAHCMICVYCQQDHLHSQECTKPTGGGRILQYQHFLVSSE